MFVYVHVLRVQMCKNVGENAVVLAASCVCELCMYVCMPVYMYVCMYVCVWLYMDVCVCAIM